MTSEAESSFLTHASLRETSRMAGAKVTILNKRYRKQSLLRPKDEKFNKEKLSKFMVPRAAA